MNRKRTKSSEIIKRAKANSAEKKNITFRVNEDIIDRFKKKCKREDVKYAAVIEELMKSFLDD